MAFRAVACVAFCTGIALGQFPNPSTTKKVPATIQVKKGEPFDGKPFGSNMFGRLDGFA